MHPNGFLALLRLKQLQMEKRLDAQARQAELDNGPNDVTADQALQGRFSMALARLRELRPRRSPRLSRPLEPSGS